MSLYERLIALGKKEDVKAEDIPERRLIELSLYLSSKPDYKPFEWYINRYFTRW